jgi:hypothetical protein
MLLEWKELMIAFSGNMDGLFSRRGGNDTGPTMWTHRGRIDLIAARRVRILAFGVFTYLTLSVFSALAQDMKPNFVIIWGDDIGQSNLSIFTKGMMGYQTPAIDSIAREVMLFTDYYAEQSCTAGRSAFITGQSVFAPA